MARRAPASVFTPPAVATPFIPPVGLVGLQAPVLGKVPTYAASYAIPVTAAVPLSPKGNRPAANRLQGELRAARQDVAQVAADRDFLVQKLQRAEFELRQVQNDKNAAISERDTLFECVQRMENEKRQETYDGLSSPTMVHEPARSPLPEEDWAQQWAMLRESAAEKMKARCTTEVPQPQMQCRQPYRGVASLLQELSEEHGRSQMVLAGKIGGVGASMNGAYYNEAHGAQKAATPRTSLYSQLGNSRAITAAKPVGMLALPYEVKSADSANSKAVARHVLREIYKQLIV